MVAWRLLCFFTLYNSLFVSGCITECSRSCHFDCQDYYTVGHRTSGVYYVRPGGMESGYDVYCDMTTDGGGWLVFQRRVDGSVDFHRNWTDYEFGFGEVSHEHWLGLVPLKRLLKHGDYEIRFDLEDFDGETRFAKYKLFDIGDPGDNYTLTIRGYSGTAGDAMSLHDRQMFSTPDRDNDIWNPGQGFEHNCAFTYKGGWWYNNCHHANLNGVYKNGYYTGVAMGIDWAQWRGFDYSLKMTEIKIKRA